MTERRAHWDDDLIRSVHRVSPVSMLMPPNDVYAIIAAVEDRMDANDNPLPHVLNECLQWLDAERAAIQRVREEVDGDNPIPKASDDFDNVAAYCAGYVDALRRVRRALDGSDSASLEGGRALDPHDAPLIDPDCRDGKHSSCVGGPCECPCHELAAS